MYLPPHFREERMDVLGELMRKHTLATLVTFGPDGLIANHLPLIFDPEPAPLGTLRGHLARSNPQWRESRPDVEALAIFQGPSAYITPNWYRTTEETGRVVPTYNFAVVHAYGPLGIVDDPARLAAHVRALTALHEAGFPNPWSVGDAPADFIRAQLTGIVGIEIPVSRLEGKWKMSQNRVEADRRGVVEGLRASGDPQDAEVAGWVEAKLESGE